MRKAIISTTLFTFLINFTFAQVIFEKQFQLSPNPNNLNSSAVSVVEAPDGGFIIAGNTKNSTGADRIFTMKIAANGDSVWSKIYSYTGFVQAFAKNLFYNKKGNLTLFANVTRQGLGAWAYFFELDEKGDTIKIGRFKTDNGYVVQDVVQLADSGYVFTANNSSTTSRIYRIDKKMTQQWQYQPFPSLQDSVPVNALFNGIVNRGDSLYLSGRLGFGGAVETYFSKWDISGNKKYFKKYGFGTYLSVVDMEITSQNIALLAGNVRVQTSPGLFTDAFAVLKLSLAGDSLGLVTVDGPVTDNAYHITKANGKYLITGLGSEPVEGAQTAFVMCLDEAGTLLWHKNIFIPVTNQTPHHYGYQTIETSTGDFLMVGKRDGVTPNTNRSNLYVVKFKPDPVSAKSTKIHAEKAYIFPNPASYQAIIKDNDFNNGANAQITITDVSGRIVYNTQVNDAFLLPIMVNQLDAGIYMVYKNNRLMDKIQVVK